MDAEERADIIRKSFDIIEKPVEAYEGPANPTREYWEELRAYHRPKLAPTQPHWPAVDTAVGQTARDEYVDQRAFACIDWQWKHLYRDVHASVIATERRRVRRELKTEAEALRRELAAEVATLQCQLDEARGEIKRLREDTST